MNKMLLVGSVGIVLLFVVVSLVWVDDNVSIFLFGYVQFYINYVGMLCGVWLVNNYEMLLDWGLIILFVWLNGSQCYFDESSNGCVIICYYFLFVGFLWKINNQLSLYS